MSYRRRDRIKVSTAFKREVAFKNVHPTETARRPGPIMGMDLPPWQGSEGDESSYVRCQWCGFPNYVRTTPPGSGWGNNTNQAIAGTSTARDPIAGAGCGLCGSSNYWPGLGGSA